MTHLGIHPFAGIRSYLTESSRLRHVADPLFDANEYANAILAGEQYKPSQPKQTTKSVSTTNEGAKEDISVASAKLSFGIEDILKQLKTVVRVISSSSFVLQPNTC